MILLRVYLKIERKKLGYTQQQVADLASISRWYYYQLETGKRGKQISLMIAGRIASALELPLDLFYYNEREYLKHNENNY